VDEVLMLVPAAAGLLSISEESCYDMIRLGFIPAVQVDNVTRVPLDFVFDLIYPHLAIQKKEKMDQQER